MARLYVLSGDLVGRTFDVDGEVVVGRSDEADVSIVARSVSRQHARLKPLGGGRWRVVDLGSSNGTFVEGVRVDDAVVGDGDVFTLGDVELRLRDAAAAPRAPEAPADAPAEEPGGELELEFDDDLDAALGSAPKGAGAAPPAPRSSPGSAPRARGDSGSTPRARGGPARASGDGAAATRDRAARRAAAMGGRARTGGGVVEDTGRPILQYAQTRSGGTDVSQIGGLGRVALVLFAIALLGGVAYLAFWLTQGGPAG